jgi:hypothetical protein
LTIARHRVLAVALLVLAAAASAAAQPRRPVAAPRKPPAKPAERLFVSVSGGIQTAPAGFDDAFDLPLNAENEHVTVDYPSKVGGRHPQQQLRRRQGEGGSAASVLR